MGPSPWVVLGTLPTITLLHNSCKQLLMATNGAVHGAAGTRAGGDPSPAGLARPTWCRGGGILPPAPGCSAAVPRIVLTALLGSSPADGPPAFRAAGRRGRRHA